MRYYSISLYLAQVRYTTNLAVPCDSRTFHIIVILRLCLQSVPITTKVVSANLAHGEVYSIQHYVIKFVSDLGQVICLVVEKINL
jgi:hypothetical protein